MAQKKLRWVKGNYLKLAIPLVEEYVQAGEKKTRPYKFPAVTETPASLVEVTLIGERHRHEFGSEAKSVTRTEAGKPDVVIVTDDGTIPADMYAVEVTVNAPGDDTVTPQIPAHKLRSMWLRALEVACDNSPKEAEYDGFLGEGSLELEAAVFYSTNGPTANEALETANARMGYYVCNTAGNLAYKEIDAPNFQFAKGGSLKVLMRNKNTFGTGQVYLKINNGDENPPQKMLRYNGNSVSPTNTWDDDEIIEVFGDGEMSFQSTKAVGSGVFYTNEKVTDVKIITPSTETVDENGLPTVGKMNAAINSAVSGEATARQNGLNQKENLTNKVTSVNADSTDVQYPTAKALYYERMARQDADVQLQSQINEIVGGNATVGLTVSQSAIFANTETKVNVKATSSIDADSISISKDGTEIATAVNDHELEKKNVSLNLAGGTSVTFSAAFVIKGVNKPEQTKTVTAYDKIYYGVGTENNHANLTPVGTVETSAAGTYSFTFTPQSDKKYIYILIPKTMSPSNPPIDLTKVKLPSGFGYNLQLVAQNEDYKGDGVLYYVYRSVDYNNQNVTLIIS